MIEAFTGPYGLGIQATRPFSAGESIVAGWGRRVPKRTRHSIQVDINHYLDFPAPIRLINHSCDPNCGYDVRVEEEILSIVALRSIAPGEELTADYATFEEEIWFMPEPCLCGSPICRGRIGGFWDLPEERREAYGRFVAPYLRELVALQTSRAG